MIDSPSKVEMLRLNSAFFHAYFIYDVADTIDLAKLQSTDVIDFKKAQIELRSLPAPTHIQFVVPPLAAKLGNITIDNYPAEIRLKLYDYGIVSIRASFPFLGKWKDYVDLTQQLRQSENLAMAGEQLLSDILQHIGHALNKPHKHLLEDYFIFEIEALQTALPADDLLKNYRSELASLISGETKPLHLIEQEEALKASFSYFETDLVIIQWDAAFIYDTRENAEAVESILEFANTQLVELRTYDTRLDEELDEIYKWDLTRGKRNWFFQRWKRVQYTDRIRSLLVDIRELVDRGNNALKIIGDAFYARLYRGAAARLRLSDWEQQLESKLDSVGEIYGLATDQAQHARSEFLEIIIIVLILIEILLGFLRYR